MRRLWVLIFCLIGSLSKAQLPDDFYDQVFISGLDFATGFTHDENGNMYVWEKKGTVYRFDSNGQRTTEPFLDISEEVSNWKDHGLMGFALDPNFSQNGYCYALYTLDLHYLNYFGTNDYHPDSTVTFAPTIGRVTRFQTDPQGTFEKINPESRKVLLGESISTGIPLLYEFHGLGTLIAAEDGTLLISTGDATGNLIADTGGDPSNVFVQQAIQQGIITPDQDLGSYRAQYLGSMNGKILRISSETGDGLPSNPFFDPDSPRSPQSRVWARGFRNPYRMILKPESGSHYANDGDPGEIIIGDVGNGAWEELNIADRPGMNFGWPLIEGYLLMWAFWSQDVPPNPRAKNPLFGAGCDTEYLTFKMLFSRESKRGSSKPTNPCNPSQLIPDELFPSQETTPVMIWSNARWNTPTRAMILDFQEDESPTGMEITDSRSTVEGENFDGFSSMAGVWYTGESFPEEYHDTYFGMDFSGWIKVFLFDEQGAITEVRPFHDDATNIIHMGMHPSSGDVFYLNLEGEIHRITYGGNPPPKAILEANTFYGPSPLTVQFDGSSSFDEQQPIIAYEWDFGNGQTSSAIAPTITFETESKDPESFQVTLTVTDSLGASSTVSKIVSLNNTPPQVRITSFADSALYPIDRTTLLSLEADVLDAEHPDDQLLYAWKTYLHHNDHFHPEPTDYEHLSFTLISPLGCTNELYWYRIELTVTDPAGLSTMDSRTIHPYCGEDFVRWIRLEGEAQNKSIAINWESNLEKDVASYIVQRSSDFYLFESLGTVAASSENLNYSFVDPSPRLGDNIYRIKAVRENGAYNYSDFLSISYPRPLPVRITPNPADDIMELFVKQAQSDRILFELFSPAGVRIQQIDWPAQIGEATTKTLALSQIPSGAYFYRVKNGQETKVGKLIISH